MQQQIYQLVIIGGGPAGIAAGVYAARKRIRAVLVTESFGGQSLVSATVENWIGVKSISGFEFGKMLEEHLKAQDGIEIVEGARVTSIMQEGARRFSVATEQGKTFLTERVLIASGSRRRKLNIPGEKEWEGKGVSYCSICDAPIFKGKNVAVIGGGNAGLEAVIDLLPYASSVYLLERSDTLRGDPVTQEKVRAAEKVRILFHAEAKEIHGDATVTSLRYLDTASGKLVDLPVEGIFVEIGILPNSDIVRGLVQLNARGEIVVDHKTQRASVDGIWAAGDVADGLYNQNNISAGDAVKAVLNIYDDIVKSSHT